MNLNDTGAVLFAIITAVWVYTATEFTLHSILVTGFYVIATISLWAICPLINVLSLLMHGAANVPIACIVDYHYAMRDNSSEDVIPVFTVNLNTINITNVLAGWPANETNT